jgi:hypothetical protein
VVEFNWQHFHEPTDGHKSEHWKGEANSSYPSTSPFSYSASRPHQPVGYSALSKALHHFLSCDMKSTSSSTGGKDSAPLLEAASLTCVPPGAYPDLIVCSDCLYDCASVRPLLQALSWVRSLIILHFLDLISCLCLIHDHELYLFLRW